MERGEEIHEGIHEGSSHTERPSLTRRVESPGQSVLWSASTWSIIQSRSWVDDDGNGVGAISESESEIGNEDTRGFESKRKQSNVSNSSDSSQSIRKEETYLVGMIAATQVDGIFMESHVVRKFIERKIGVVPRSVRITRSGMGIIDCVSKRQRDRALKVGVYSDFSCLTCSPLGAEVRK